MFKDEAGVIRAVVRTLPGVFTQSMTSASMTMNGIPDRYFDGTNGDAWVEFKFWPYALRSDSTISGVDGKRRGYYTPLQEQWMTRRWNVGRNVLGMVGLRDGRIAVHRDPEEWSRGTHILKTFIVDVKGAADCIRKVISSGSL